MSSLPILRNHDPGSFLGGIELLEDGRAVATFKPETITVPLLVGLSGGWRVLEQEERDGVAYVLRAELLLLSTSTPLDLGGHHAGVYLERCWREFLAQHPEVRAMPGPHVDKIKRVWLDGCQSAQQVLVDGNPEGPKDLERVRAVLRELADSVMAEITRIHGRQN